MKAQKERIKKEDVTYSMVQFAVFGCTNCLWNCVECEQGKRFEPATFRGEPTCKNYTYYD
jgi:hypothetical protein